MPFFVALGGATWRATIAVAVVYTLTFSLGGLEPWFARSTSAYFRIPLARMLELTAPPLALLAVAHGTLLGALLLARPRRAGPRQVLWCAALWAGWEYVRTLVFPYYPAAVLGLSQHATVAVLQLASLTGVAGVSFVLLACNVGLASLIAPSGAHGRARAAAAATGIAAAAVTIAWGTMRIAGGMETSSGPRVAAVDVNARERSTSTLARYLAASEDAASTRPALLVWPESALITDLEHDPSAWTVLTRFVAEHGTPLLAGGPGAARSARRGVAHFNSAHLITPGHGMRSYHKRRLVPLAERWSSLLGSPPPELASLEAGEEATVFSLGDTAFGVLICFEITDAAGARALARGGARFIVNMTNDAWFIGSARPPHLPWAAVRAVETGLPVVRASNAGPSAVFDRFGRPVASSRPADGPAVLTAHVPAAAPTLYARTGDVFLGLCVATVLAGLAHAMFRRTG